MTRQEMFDKAVRGLRSQGFWRCVTPEGGCAYTSDCGTKHCAFGWIDTSLTRQETRFVSGLIRDGVGVAGKLDAADYEFVGDLQQAHDDSFTPKTMQERLRRVAARYNLTYPED